MIVVGDSSPLNFLLRLGHAHILPHLFEQIVIPPEVEAELSQPATPAPVRSFIASPPPWLHVQAARKRLVIPGIDAGELAAISLAVEIGADLLLIDDMAGRKAAQKLNLEITGTIGVLVRAANEKLIEPAAIVQQLHDLSDFWMDQQTLERTLHGLLKRDH